VDEATSGDGGEAVFRGEMHGWGWEGE